MYGDKNKSHLNCPTVQASNSIASCWIHQKRNRGNYQESANISQQLPSGRIITIVWLALDSHLKLCLGADRISLTRSPHKWRCRTRFRFLLITKFRHPTQQHEQNEYIATQRSASITYMICVFFPNMLPKSQITPTLSLCWQHPPHHHHPLGYS